MKCKVCGGVEFSKEDCYYYCNECQTRCEELVERVVEEDYTDKDKLDFKTNISKNTATEDVYQWTTWEAYNHVLKGMVDELINLGASQKLKVTVLQLWVRYLQFLKAAFLPPGLLPKLGPGYNPRDAKVVYSINTKGSVKRKRHSTSSVVRSDQLSLSKARGRAKRALVKSELSQSEASSNVSTSASEYSFASSKSFRRSNYMTNEGVKWDNKKKKIKSPLIAGKISRLKLIGILYLGLLLSKDNIQLSDLLRWIREGHLSYYIIIHLLPKNIILNGRDRWTFGSCSKTPSYTIVRKVTRKLATELGIDDIPLPDFPYLIRRYIKELELPEEMAKFAINVWAACPPRMQIKKENKGKDRMDVFSEDEQKNYFVFKKYTEEEYSKGDESKMTKGEIPNYEGRAMAIVLFSMKLIFGLDGYTESNLSQFARKANKLLLLDHSYEKFFVWGDWVKYIEFRNQLVDRYHFPTSYCEEPEQVHMFRDIYSIVPPLPPYQNFNKCIKLLQRFSESDGHYEKLSKAEWQQFMKKELDEIIGNEVQLPMERLHITFEASVTPYFSYFKQLYENIILKRSWSQNLNGMPNEELFSASFHSSSLEYVLNSKRCIEDLKEKGVSVTVIKGSACPKDQVKYVKPVQIIRDKDSGTPINKKELFEVVLTDDTIDYKKKIDWFEKIDKTKLLVGSKKKVSTSVTKDRDFQISHTKKKQGKSIKTSVKSKTHRKPKIDFPSKKVDNLCLHLPHKMTWLSYGSFIELSGLHSYYFTQRFPFSFQWLLKLCAKNLEMSEVSLYSELVDVELVHKSNVTWGTSTKDRNSEVPYERRKTVHSKNNW